VDEVHRPLPVANDLTRPYWEAASRRELVIQRCGRCGHWIHLPARTCENCYSVDLHFEQVTGRGTIASTAIARAQIADGFEAPFACIAVELDEQPGLLVVTNLLGVAPDDAVIGRRVRVCFETLTDNVVLPQFELEWGTAGDLARP
jgi:uncharacterized OB-fold protein